MAFVNQELYCHNCNRYVQFRIDEELDGQHTIVCPNCGHEHYRYVNKGVISEQRWASSNQQVYPAYTYGYTVTSSSVSSTGSTTSTFSWTYGSYATSTS